MLLEDATFVVTDTETTGSRAGEDRLIEIGAVKVRGGEVVGRFQQLINPARHVPRRITRLTGISTAMVYDQPTAAEVLPGYLDFLGDGILTAHNLPFDRRFLDVEMDLAGLGPLKNEGLCTLRLARRLLGALRSKGLTAVAAHYGIKIDGRHRALGDAEATAEILLLLLPRLRNEFAVTTVPELLAFQRKRYKDTRREPSHLKAIREETLPDLPNRPGVYFMKDRRGRVIYVGKAKNLRNRVRSYFTGVDAHPPKTRKLVRDVRDVEWRETGTELSALLDESRLIKRLLPVYNRAQRRYRDYPFLKLDVAARYPTLTWSPVIRDDGAEYYGPVGRRGQAEELVELVSRLFPLRECDDEVFALGRPCLYAEMGRCTAPCIGGPGAHQYAAVVERVRQFLTGQDDNALRTVEDAMRAAASRMEFEQAGWYRDQLRRLERTMGRQRQIARAVHDHHAVLVEPLENPEPGEEGAQLFFIRHGRLVERWDLRTPVLAADRATLKGKLGEHFSDEHVPPPVFLRKDVDEIRILAYWMRLREGETRLVRADLGGDPDALSDEVILVATTERADPVALDLED